MAIRVLEVVCLTLLSIGCTLESADSPIVDSTTTPPDGPSTDEDGGAATSADDSGSATHGAETGTGSESGTGAGGDTDGTGTESSCGDGVLDPGENCDGEAFGGDTCATFGFSSGELGCDALCHSSTSGCFTCGDGVVQDAEACDGDNLFGKTCETLGFGPGTAMCSADCMTVDTAACDPAPECGDGIRNGSEACDGTDVNGKDCVSLGFADGTLGCAADCSALDTSGCPMAVCGDGEKNGTDQCDGADVGADTCLTQGFDYGLLVCSESCTYDTSQCVKECRAAGQACSGPTDCCNTGCGKGGCSRIVNGQSVCCT